MKKSIILILGLSLILTSCTIDWKDENKTKIEKLEKQVEELKKKKENIVENKKIKINDLFEKKQECRWKKEEITKILKKWDEINSIFYSPSKNSCFVAYITYETEYEWNEPIRDYPVHIIRDIFTLEFHFNKTDWIEWEQKIKELKWE